MKKILQLMIVLQFNCSVILGQWIFNMGTIPPAPDTMNTYLGVQFIVVDANDRIWVNPHSTVGDSLFVPDSNQYKQVSPVYVYNPDGILWKKIASVTVGGSLYPFYNYGSGIEKDNNGNILVVKKGMLYRVNYQTGEGMNVPFSPFDGNSTGSPAVDAAGNIYCVQVLSGAPLKIFDTDFNFLSNVDDTVPGIGRYCEASGDGFTIYVPRFEYENKFVIRYRKTSEFGSYDADTILQGAVVESGTWDPVDPTKVWFSVGSEMQPPSGIFEGKSCHYLMFDTTTWAYSDSIIWQGIFNELRPRGIAFSANGTRAYLGVFGSNLPYPVQYQDNPQHISSMIELHNTPDYMLQQNYPNPFNPITVISYQLPVSSDVTLKVYDILGNEIATLVDEYKPAGSYNVEFTINNLQLSSGIYFYKLQAGEYMAVKKMILIK